MSDLPTGPYTVEAALGIALGLVTTWMGKLHVGLATAQKELDSHKRDAITRAEFKDDLREHKEDQIRANSQLEASINSQFTRLSNAIERVERRLDSSSNHG